MVVYITYSYTRIFVSLGEMESAGENVGLFWV